MMKTHRSPTCQSDPSFPLAGTMSSKKKFTLGIAQITLSPHKLRVVLCLDVKMTFKHELHNCHDSQNIPILGIFKNTTVLTTSNNLILISSPSKTE